MICNRCGVELPENSLFCFRCGNKLEQAPSQPKEQKSSSPFGTKTISDRHYSLEDIARQQREKEKDSGFDLSEPAPRRKKKKRQPSEDQALPPVGSSDKMNTAVLGQLSAAQAQPDESSYQQEQPAYEQKSVYPQEQPAYEQKPVYPQEQLAYDQKPVYPQEQPAYEQKPVYPQEQPAYEQKPAYPQEQPAQTPETEQVPVPAAQSAPNETAAVQNQTPVPQKTKAAFRYTITTPPVPLGLQRQTHLRLFGGNISTQIEELRRSYIEKKNGG